MTTAARSIADAITPEVVAQVQANKDAILAQLKPWARAAFKLVWRFVIALLPWLILGTVAGALKKFGDMSINELAAVRDQHKAQSQGSSAWPEPWLDERVSG